MYRIVQLDNLNDPRVAEAEAVWHEARKTSIVTNTMTAGRDDLRRLIAKAWIRAGVVGGKLYVALSDQEQVVAVAVWYPAGKDFLADEQQRQAGASEVFAKIELDEPEIYQWWMSTLVPLTGDMIDKFLGKGFKTKNWNLYALTVAETHRCKGIAKMLIRVGEDQAAALGLSTCFEADNRDTIMMYERLGYKIAGSTFMPGPPNMEGFYCFSMVKHHDNKTQENIA